jgi:hypothetical protein
VLHQTPLEMFARVEIRELCKSTAMRSAAHQAWKCSEHTYDAQKQQKVEEQMENNTKFETNELYVEAITTTAHRGLGPS